MINLLVQLVVIGFLLWAVEAAIPMNATIKRIIEGLGILIAVLLVLRAFRVV